MIYLALGLSLAAVIILIVDIYIEGFGILGVFGLILLGVSIFINVSFVPFGTFIVIGKLVIIIPGIIFFVRYLRRKGLYGKLVLNETLAEDKKKDLSELEGFLGREGVTLTALRPFGRAEFDGVSVEVCTESVYLPADERVKVVQFKDKKLFVKPIKE